MTGLGVSLVNYYNTHSKKIKTDNTHSKKIRTAPMMLNSNTSSEGKHNVVSILTQTVCERL